jgi:hypothetical protein
MGVIKVSTNDKDIELTNLEAHVQLAAGRYQVIEKRLDRIEARIDTIVEQSKHNVRIFIGALVTIATGTITSVIVIHLKLL